MIIFYFGNFDDICPLHLANLYDTLIDPGRCEFQTILITCPIPIYRVHLTRSNVKWYSRGFPIFYVGVYLSVSRGAIYI